MGQVLNQRDFYYGAFIFALLNKKIRPAAIVESGDDCHQVCTMDTDVHGEFKLIMKHSTQGNSQEGDNWSRQFTLQEKDIEELKSGLVQGGKVKLALICAKSQLNDSEIAILNNSAIRKLLAMGKNTFLIKFGKNAKKIAIIKDRTTEFTIKRNWQDALLEPEYEEIEEIKGPNKEVLSEHELMELESVTHSKPVKLIIDSGCYVVNSWKSVFINLCGWLWECDAAIFREFASASDFQSKKRRVVQCGDAGMKRAERIGGSVYVETNYSAQEFLKYSKLMIEKYQDKYQLEGKIDIVLAEGIREAL